ncbi:hypothetical protein [Pseudomonas chlororaphis]|uniref:hypothetical protein n=1 Tax=Pseudomonas chlororaphis TaxID=587753 RepID=UPI0019D2403A|nr:hypothetical protein [Pseudomonas chlororaphis]
MQFMAGADKGTLEIDIDELGCDAVAEADQALVVGGFDCRFAPDLVLGIDALGGGRSCGPASNRCSPVASMIALPVLTSKRQVLVLAARLAAQAV